MDPIDRTVILYSPQAPAVLQALARDGRAFSKRDYVKAKYGESAPVFLTAYDAFCREAEEIVPRPNGAEYPYWAFADPASLELSGDGKVLRLQVPITKAVFFDRYDWYKILRLSFLGESPDEERAFAKELALRGIRDPSEVMLTSFYPGLRDQILESWKRLFRFDAAVKAGEPFPVDRLQASLWELREEWILPDETTLLK